MDDPGGRHALIERLVADAKPVRRLWSPGVRLVLWMAVTAGLLASPAARVLRADLSLRLTSPGFMLEQALLLVGAALLGFEALRGAVPGCSPGRATVVVGSAALALALLWMLRAPVHRAWTAETFLEVGRPCLWRAFAWGAVPWLLITIALRRGLPLARRRTGALAGAATWALVCVALRFCCQTDELLHLGAFHAAPLLAGVLASALIAPVALAERRAPLPGR
jgi:hypothetical protein